MNSLKIYRKRFLSLLVAGVTLAGTIFGGNVDNVYATEVSEKVMSAGVLERSPYENSRVSEDITYQGNAATSNNAHHQNYWDWSNWAVPVYSYLADNGDGTLTRVEYITGTIVVEKYNELGEICSSLQIPMELTIFGGFFSGTDANYFVFGQNNPNQDDSMEVIRIVKYSKDWQRISHVSVYGANTTVPFRAASLRMCESSSHLYVRTAHGMYASSDGLNHQANMTISVKKSDMTIADCDYQVSAYNFGYCSHSFNQFIDIVDGHLVAVDHGDAYPRSIVLTCSNNDAESGVLKIDYWNQGPKYNLISFPGSIGQNFTGAMLGGFETSDTHYLVTGCCNTHDSNFANNKVKNVFLSVTPKDESGEPQTIWLTDYTESGNYSTTNAQLVEVDKNHYLVMWERYAKNSYGYFSTVPEMGTYIAIVDGAGNQLGRTMFINAQLSDCQPIVANNKVIWYVTNNSVPQFYSFSADIANIESFVERMYTVALGRTSDPWGKADWSNQLMLLMADGATLAEGFIMSEESQGRGLSDEEYIDVLYKTFFNRAADEGGKQNWLNHLESGKSRRFVLAGFANSDEFNRLCQDYGIKRGYLDVSNEPVLNAGVYRFVSRLYDKVLDRGSDREGIVYWTQCIMNGSRSPEEVAKNFFLSEEYVKKNTTDKQYVITLYRTFMDRDPDEQGIKYWLNTLSGGATRESVLEGFARSPEFAEIMASFGL